MSTAVISLGSNLGDRTAHLQRGVDAFGPEVRAVSSIYQTPPWGSVAQDDYYNLVFIVEDDSVDAGGWLEKCFAAEQAEGRRRDVRWGPRTLDADVVSVDDQRNHEDPDLVLPHPRAHERAFVLVPWAEIDPGAELPGFGGIAELLEHLDTSAIRRVGHVR